MKFIGKLLDADEMIEFGFGDMAAVYLDDNVMYISDGNTPIVLSSVELVSEGSAYIVSEIDIAMMPESPYMPPPIDNQAMAEKLIRAGYVVISPAELDTLRYVGGPCPTCERR